MYLDKPRREFNGLFSNVYDKNLAIKNSRQKPFYLVMIKVMQVLWI